jgi:hypothetical protein
MKNFKKSQPLVAFTLLIKLDKNNLIDEKKAGKKGENGIR